MATTIGESNIQLTADAAGFAQDLSRAERSMGSFATTASRTLARVGEFGERFTSTIGRAEALGTAFARLGDDATNKLAAGIDVAQASIGTLVSSMMIAKATGASLFSGFASGFAGLAVGTILSSLSRPETAGSRFSATAGVSRFGLADIGTLSPTHMSRRARAASEGEAIGGVGADAEAAARRFGTMADTIGLTSERIELLSLMRRRDELVAEHGRDITGSPVYAALSSAIEDARRELGRLTEARERDRRAAMDAAEAERLRAEHSAAFRADMDRGRAVTESLMSPRERAVAELRELEYMRTRTPGSISEDAIRRRAEVLAGGLGATGPTGPAALGIGESATISTINAAIAAARGGGESAEDLLREVRDEIGRLRDAVTRTGDASRATLGGIFGVMTSP